MPPNFSKLFQNKIFLVSIGIFTLICLLFGVYFYNNQGKSTNSKQNSQTSTSSNSNSQINSANSLLGSNNSQISSSNSSSSQNSTQNSNNLTNSSQKVENLLTNSNSILPSNLTNNSANSTASSNSSQNNSTNLSINCTPNSNLIPNNSQTYTNPNYPNLKINYDKSWKISIESVPFYNSKELCEGRITLTKNNSKLTFELVPSFYISGMAGEYILKEVKVGTMVRTYYTDMEGKKFPNQENYYSYVKENSTDDGVNGNNSIVLKTNIIVNNLSDQDKEKFHSVTSKGLVKNGILYYLASIQLDSNNSTEIAQADEIIKNSILE